MKARVKLDSLSDLGAFFVSRLKLDHAERREYDYGSYRRWQNEVGVVQPHVAVLFGCLFEI